MLSASRCRCSHGSKLLINHGVHEEHEANPILKGLRVLCVLRGYFESLRAFFEGSGFAAQMRERFAREME